MNIYSFTHSNSISWNIVKNKVALKKLTLILSSTARHFANLNDCGKVI